MMNRPPRHDNDGPRADRTHSNLVLEAFAPANRKIWRERVERELEGRSIEETLVSATPEGIAIPPLHTDSSSPPLAALGHPGVFPYVRGSRPAGQGGWLVVAHHGHSEASELNRALRDDLERGADAVSITFARTDDLPPRGAATTGPRAGGASDGEIATGLGGTLIASLADLEIALDGVVPRCKALFLEPGRSALPTAATLQALLEKQGRLSRPAALFLGADPLGTLAREGSSDGLSLEQLEPAAAALALACARSWPDARAIRVSMIPYQEAGAHPVQELAFAAATTVHYLRLLDKVGLNISEAAGQLALSFPAGRDVFGTIAKLRAARWMWARIIQACGTRNIAPFLHVQTSLRTLARRNRWVNMLRVTTQVFSAALAGADAVTAHPFDAVMNRGTSLGRRLARNTQTILREEAHLAKVTDPAGGSYYIETLTRELAGKAWTLFQEIERHGGMGACLTSGWIHEILDQTSNKRLEEIRRRKLAVVGVSHYVWPQEVWPQEVWPQEPRPIPFPSISPVPDAVAPVPADPLSGRPPVTWLDHLTRAARDGSSIPELARALPRAAPEAGLVAAGPLPRQRDAAPFEALRDAADDLARHSGRPGVYLACLGPAAEYRARAAFARRVFQIGGLDVAEGQASEPAAGFAGGGFMFACLVGSNARYVHEARGASAALRSAGARVILAVAGPLAGKEGGPLAGAPIDELLHEGMDAWKLLSRLIEASRGQAEVGS